MLDVVRDIIAVNQLIGPGCRGSKKADDPFYGIPAAAHLVSPSDEQRPDAESACDVSVLVTSDSVGKDDEKIRFGRMMPIGETVFVDFSD
jgi:hypothetical protein